MMLKFSGRLQPTSAEGEVKADTLRVMTNQPSDTADSPVVSVFACSC